MEPVISSSVWKKKVRFLIRTAVLTLVITRAAPARAVPPAFMYQGRIVSSSGQPLEYSAVAFEFTVTSPDGTCVLYREQRTGMDMRNSKGVFETPIGSGTKSYPASPSFTLIDAFNNAGSLTCDGGATYSPAADDGRRLRVQFFDGTGWKLISPDQVIRSVPYAAYAGTAQTANRLGAHAANSYVLRSEFPTCTGTDLLTFNGISFSCAPAGAGGAGSGTVTSITAGTGLTGGTISVSGTIGLGTELAGLNGLSSTGFIKRTGAGAYSAVTSLSLATDVTGTLPVANGGTGATTASGALNNLLPAQSGNAGKLLQTDGTSASWVVAPATGITALTGDVSASGSGSAAATIAASAVTSSKIADGTIAVSDLDFAGAMAVNTGIIVRNGTQFFNKTCSGNEILVWSVSNGWVCSTMTFVEADPQVGSNTTNYVSKWDGSALVASGIFESGGSVGIGTTSLTSKLNVDGAISAKGYSQSVSFNGISQIANVNISTGSLAVAETAVSSSSSALTMSSFGSGFSGTLGGLPKAGTNLLGGYGTTFIGTTNASPLYFLTDNSIRMAIGATGDLGIGTTTPGYKLHVNGSSTATAAGDVASAFNYMYADNSASSAARFIGQYNGTETGGATAAITGEIVGQASYSKHNSVSALTKLSGSWAGVYNTAAGTVDTAVGVQGEVNNDSTGVITTAMGVQSSVKRNGAGAITNGYGLYIDSVQATNKWSVYAADATAPSYFAGYVGIGTTTPGTPFESRTTTAFGTKGYYAGQFGNIGIGGVILGTTLNGLNGLIQSGYADQANNFDVISNLTINPGGGNVGIGTASPSQKLHVDVGSDIGRPMLMTSTATVGSITLGAQNGNGLADFGVSANGDAYIGSATATKGIRFFTSGGQQMTILNGGNVGIGTATPGEKLTVYNGSTTGAYTTTGWTHTSDIRMKKDIHGLENSLDKILQLKGVEYKFKTDSKNKKQIGFIAQQVEPIFPEVVQTDENGMKSMVYANLVAPVIEAIKTLYSRVVNVERGVASVQDEIEQLKIQNQQLEQENKAKTQEIEAIKTYLCAKDPQSSLCQNR